jgi:hypothetical protein
MMSAGARVAAFVALLAAIFACAALAGAAIDPGGGGARQHPHPTQGRDGHVHTAVFTRTVEP